MEGLVTRKTLVHAGEVDVPREVNRLRVLSPVPIHFLDIVCVGAIRERVVRRRRVCCRRGQLAAQKQARASCLGQAVGERDAPQGLLGEHLGTLKTFKTVVVAVADVAPDALAFEGSDDGDVRRRHLSELGMT